MLRLQERSKSIESILSHQKLRGLLFTSMPHISISSTTYSMGYHFPHLTLKISKMHRLVVHGSGAEGQRIEHANVQLSPTDHLIRGTKVLISAPFPLDR
uniref:28S ribosomal protein S29 n=1 Tax=Rhizophora mucronata TaxID=61149 RepID=A0A2P2JPN7_RHIMU